MVIPLSFLLLGFSHPFYVSICQVDYNPRTGSFEISFKIFTDDLKKALEAGGVSRPAIGSEREGQDIDRHIFEYLKSHFEMQVNDRPVEMRFVRKKVDMDVTWCYIEVPRISEVKTVTVTNRILRELFAAQTNIVHVRVGETQRSMLLRKDKVSDTVRF